MDDRLKKTLYFARPACAIGSEAESLGISELNKLRPRHRVIITQNSLTQPALGTDDYVFLSFADGKIAAEIAREIRQRLRLKREVNEMHVDEQNMPIPMISNITELDRERVLTDEETKARTMPEPASKPKPISHVKRFELQRDGRKRPTFVER